MSPISFLRERFLESKKSEAMVWRDRVYSYDWLLGRIDFWNTELERAKVGSGRIVVLETDFSPDSTALFLALAERRCILVPIADTSEAGKSRMISIAQAEILFSLKDRAEITNFPREADSELYSRLRKMNHPGLVLFSSGSSGAPKAVVHDLAAMLEKFKVKRHRRKTILFLLFDHIGGLNTMLYTLSNGGCLVTVEDRSPDHVLGVIEKYSVEMLPTTPTFINLILLSGAYERHNFKSLRLVTYGTEPMPESTLKRFHEAFPEAELQQTYGLSEVGILRSKSKGSDSLWVKVGGEGFGTRVVDGMLQVRAQSAMLGYLNAPSPFTEDGWLITGDCVETDGDYIKILGRKSDMINVGGQKVNPVEVEGVIREMPGITDATVYSESNYVFGNFVCAKVTLREGARDPKDFVKRLKKFCAGKLDNYKIPVKVIIADGDLHTARFKKTRSAHASRIS